MAPDTHQAIEAIWRIEQAKIIAGVARITRDVGIAEELAQDALVAALKRWPEQGVPDNPAAWLMATAKNRALDEHRRAKLIERKHEEIGREMDEPDTPDLDAALDDDIGDDLLRLIFTSCHPVLSTEARVALTLRLIGGLTTEEIARAFLVPEPTVAQRIVRAKRTLTEARVPFEVPRGAALGERLASVLEVIYLIFNEGYAATAGEDWIRPALCEEALRLGRILAELAPAEAGGARARRADGDPGLAARRAHRPGRRADPAARAEPRALGPPPDPPRARARSRAPSSSARSAGLTCCRPRSRPVMRGRAPRMKPTGRASPRSTSSLRGARRRRWSSSTARSRWRWRRARRPGLNCVDALTAEPTLKNYHLLPSVRGDFLKKLGRNAEARAEFERAASLTQNARERKLLLDRAAALASSA